MASLKSPVPNKPASSSRQNVRVVCRVRPTNQREIREGGVTCVKHNEANIEVNNDGQVNNFNFDRVFGADSTQIEVFFDTAMPLVRDVLSGYNATIFAYGQTGTGKTHTMEGDIQDEVMKGIIPRSIDALFQGVEESDENIEFTFAVSYVEIYLEKIRDLLDDKGLKNNLAIREDTLKGVFIAGVTEVYVGSVEEILMIMRKGAINRATAATGMNEGSSRSHSVFTITISQTDTRTSTVTAGKLVLVDLAGSEMVRKTNASGQQLEEAKMINKSLSCLGQVINALTENQPHVPYRDSKLTRILQDSLGGNAKTVLIVAVSPSSFNASETVSTLRFGTRAKSIENKVKINQKRTAEELEALLSKAEKNNDTQAATILTLKAQLQSIEAQLQSAQSTIAAQEESIQSLQQQLSDAQARQAVDAVLQSTAEAMLSLDLDRERSGDTHKERERESDVLSTDSVSLSLGHTEIESHDVSSAAPQHSKALAKKESFRLEEGKVVVDVSRLEEDAQAILSLRDRVLSLTQELEDEKLDSQRKEAELAAVTRLLSSQEHHEEERAHRMIELEQAYNSLLLRSETLMNEKISVGGELASVKATLEEAQNKWKYDQAELEVSMARLRDENAALKKELSELTGDSSSISPSLSGRVAANNTSAISASASMSTKKKSLLSTNSHDAEEESVYNPRRLSLALRRASVNNSNGSNHYNNGQDSLSETVSSSSAAATITTAVLTAAERKELLDVFTTQYLELCKELRLSEPVVTELFALIDRIVSEFEGGFVAYERKNERLEKHYAKRTRDLEDQRNRLEKDLQGRMENLAQLQMTLDQYKRTRQAADHDEERESQRAKSLQQRLEQLVAVHRQLLRKFAALELDSVELKKKINLRDDRITQLEGTARSLIRNVRLQAEQHVSDLQTYREQVMNMKREHDYRVQLLRNVENAVASTTSPSRGMQPKALRGGKHSHSQYNSMSLGRDTSLSDLNGVDIREDHFSAIASNVGSPLAAVSSSSPGRAPFSSMIPEDSSEKRLSTSNMFSRLLGAQK